MLDWIATSLSLVVFVFYIIILFSLFEVKRRCTGKISVAFTYFITAIFLAIVIRILNLLSKSNIFSISYLSEILVVIMSFFLLMTALNFYSALKSVTDRHRKRKPQEKKYGRRIKYKTQRYKSLKYKSPDKHKPRSKHSAITKKEKKEYVRYKSRLSKNIFQSKAEKRVALKRLRKQHKKTTKHRVELKKLINELGESV